MSWALENLRFVIFSSNPSLPDAADLWKSHVSLTLDNFTTPAPGWTTASGRSPENAVELMVQSSRVDLTLSGLPDINSPTKNVYVADIDDAIRFGSAIIVKMGKKLNPNRIAFVAQKFREAKNSSEANKFIIDRVPNLPHKVDSVDLMYQTNIRFKSNVTKGLEINRVCRWMTAQRVAFQLQQGIGGVTTSTSSSGTAAIEIIDVNTVPGIKLQRVPAIFDELVVAYRLIEKGGYNAL